MPTLCRECLETYEAPGRCPGCRSPRVLTHTELFSLGVAHIDCDSFFAAVEKRDDPGLADKPVIIGGGRRGVVSTACYVARIAGVRSAMPMFRALKLCPEAVVIKPRMEAYAEASRAIKALMRNATPLVEPLSLDEAFLDLRGTERLHGGPPARTLAQLVRAIESEIGVTASIGLSHCKFLAKVASDLDKPRGFSVIGEAETLDFLAAQPVSLIWGVGAVTQARLKADGLRTIGDIRKRDPDALFARYGAMGRRLAELSRGVDNRRISGHGEMKSVSAETTFDEDIGARDALEAHLWRLAVRVADRAKVKKIAGRTVTIKLKTPSFRTVTRQRALETPTHIADALFSEGRALLSLVADDGPFRLIGIGLGDLVKATGAEDDSGDLFDPNAAKRAAAERATDRIRERFGAGAIVKGRSLT